MPTVVCSQTAELRTLRILLDGPRNHHRESAGVTTLRFAVATDVEMPFERPRLGGRAPKWWLDRIPPAS